MNQLSVGIVGGSIAGCTVAAELLRAGADVTVFERSPAELEGRGAGIAVPPPTSEDLIARDLIDADMPHCAASKHPLIGRNGDSPLGHTALTLPLALVPMNWGDIFSNLRRRVPDSAYRQGSAVVDASNEDDGAVIRLDDGSEYRFDLVIFADGYNSLGRRLLFPDVELEYRGYVLWRGLLLESELDDSSPIEDALPRLSFPELHGNAVFYFVPGPGGSSKPGDRWVNWACYVPYTPEELQRLLVDKDGRQHRSSLPPGSMRLEIEEHLKGLLSDHLPPYYADIVTASSDTYAQPIYTTDLPSYHKGRICLAGDAGAVVPPFSASGVFKATNNAIDLVSALESEADVDAAIASWSATETASSKRLTALGRQMEDAFVWQAPDLSKMDAETAAAWWKESITFPEDFTYIEETA